MANLIDYLNWRGDLSLEQSPFNEVDNLLLAELSFLDFTGIVGDVGQEEGVELRQAVDAYFRQRQGQTISMGVLVPDLILSMAEKMALSTRFAHMLLYGYRACLDPQAESQFAALTIDTGDGCLFLSFRGTDDTIVGWKEDFNMTFLPTVPSQTMALAYLQDVAAAFPRRKLRLGGHSKGGNLTVYAAVHCDAKIQRRIVNAYNNDGPGFKESLLEQPEYQAVRDRILSIVPQSSVVGMLLEHDDNYIVVQSSQQGIYQHDGFTWEVLGTRFVYVDELSLEGRINDQAIRSFMDGLDDTQRAQFVDALFEVLGSTNAQTLSQLESDGMKSLSAMLRTYKELSKEARQILNTAVKVLLRAGKENLMEGLEEKSQELRKLLNIKGSDDK